MENDRSNLRRAWMTAGLACAAAFACSRSHVPEGPADGLPAGMAPSRTALASDVLGRLKQATVFVQVGGGADVSDAEGSEGSGSGFFIAPDGRVATSWHVVSPLKQPGAGASILSGDLRIIVRSGARDQAVLPARLLAVDAEAEGCAWLPLGDAGALSETAPLWVAGFPLGRLFSVLQRGPEISVNAGHVSSLRHNDLGRLDKIQFDAAVVPGNSGGPVIAPDGRVLGVACAALGTSRVNFATPVDQLRNLLAECPLDRRVGKECGIAVASEPPGAAVYLDSVLLGTTPLQTRVNGGYHRLVVTLPDRRAWARSLSLYDGRRIEATLDPLTVTVLKAVPKNAGPARGGSAMGRGEVVFQERFADPKVAGAWDQDVGGSNRRSWYVQDGELRQFSDDGMLHAIFAGDPAWNDYAVSAKVRIAVNRKDGRAGLIFRATEDGFALFRLHRETSKIQLAYHSTRPFGWQVFEERTLPFQVQGGTWYTLEVQARGERVICLLDGRAVLEAVMRHPSRGRIGFYSVDSQASFGDAGVRRVESDDRPAAPEATLRSFWFSEHFVDDNGFWQAGAQGAAAPPWTFLHGGCLPPGPDVATAWNLLARYDIHDLNASCAVSCRSGSVGLMFRRDGPRCYVFVADPAQGKVRLLLLDGAQRKELAYADLPSAPRVPSGRRLPGTQADEDEPAAPAGAGDEGRIFMLSVAAQGDRIRAGVNGAVCIDVTDSSLSHGLVGLYADKASAVFHRLDVNSGVP